MTPRPPSKSEITQGKILAAIEDFARAKGYPPTVREIATATHISSSTVQYQLDRLERDGFIARDRKIARSIVLA